MNTILPDGRKTALSDAEHRPQPEGPPPTPPSGWSPPPPPWGAPAGDDARAHEPSNLPTAPPPPAPPYPPGQFAQPTATGQYPPGLNQPYPGAPGTSGYGQTFAQPVAQAYVAGQDTEGWVPELGVRIASAGSRIGAKAIDIVLYVIIYMAVAFASALLFLSTATTDFTTTTTGFGAGTDIVFTLVIAALLLVVDFVYNVVCTAMWGGTPGKLMVGLRVIGTDGRRADMPMAFKRWSPILVLSILGAVPLIGLFGGLGRFILLISNLVLVLTDERRRDVFDRVAGTYVITVK